MADTQPKVDPMSSATKFSTTATLIHALLAAPAERPFVTMWHNDKDLETVTFGEFITQAWGQAHHLRANGVQQGDVVILMMPQGIQLMTTFVGAMLLGAVPTILACPNVKIEAHKYHHGLTGMVEHLQARLAVVNRSFPAHLLSHFTATKWIYPTEERQPHTNPLSGASLPTLAEHDLAFIQHSSGTTGLQKGVALSHGAVLRHLHTLAQALAISEQDTVYSWLPLYHDMGLIACFMLPLVYHLPVVMQSPLDWVIQPATSLHLISQYQCTLAWMPNFAFQFLARRVPPAHHHLYDLSSLRLLTNSSEPIRSQSMEEFYAAYAPCGLRADALHTSYAMAENVFTVTHSAQNGRSPQPVWVDAERLYREQVAHVVQPQGRPAIPCLHSGSCLPGNRMRVVNERSQDVPEREIGEILIQSDTLFHGYYNHPGLTAQSYQDGWYKTGDLGFCLDGQVYITGRKKDLIIVGGKNIYPQDIEELTSQHPFVRHGRAIALGAFNPELGTEDILVVVEVVNEKYLDEQISIIQALRKTINANLGVSPRTIYLKPPGWIVKSTAGKPARQATKEKLWREQPELSHRYRGNQYEPASQPAYSVHYPRNYWISQSGA